MKEKKNRQLVAIMFTDIVGYTALMQEDEETASNVRDRHRDVFQKQHLVHHGKIIQYYGDGTLSIFKSAIEATKCAIEIQRLLQEGESVDLRIGIHLGDIVFDKTEIYGDGVNVASRIESMSVSGAILISEKINDELKNHVSISTKSLGLFEFKNVSKPLEVFAISNTGINIPNASELKLKPKPINKTIAVLPFTNISSSKDNEYFSDGISEEIINALAKIKSLKVTSRTSSFFFKNKTISIKQIAKELNVTTILEGSVRLSGNTLRITAQLIQAQEDFHFWSETWDRKLENIFEIQDEISLLIADKLREQFGHLEIQDHLVEKQTENLDAYAYSLKARYFANKWNPEDVRKSISLYEKALKLDPRHTESYLGLADSYSFLGTTGFMPFEEAWGKTIQFTNQAKKYNSNLSGVHYQLSNQAFFIEADYNKALREMTKAIQINPNDAKAQQFMSFLYIIAGDKKKSLIHLDIAISINPISEETRFFNAYFQYMIGGYSKSLDLLDKCLKINNKNIPAHSVKTLCLLKLGRYAEVVNYFDSIPPDVVILGEKTGAIALAHAFAGNTEKAKIYLEQLKEQAKSKNGFTADSYLFMMYAVLGKTKEVFEWVAQSIENKSSLLLLRFTDPIVNLLKDDLRYSNFKKIVFQTNIEESKEKTKKELLDSSLAAFYQEKLFNYINNEKPYLDQSLSLRSLAGKIDIHPNQLSWLLNEHIGKNFSEYINHYRIETFKSLSKDPKNSNITIMGLAYDSGFNSKTVFNTYFKKETGLTPKQFLELN